MNLQRLDRSILSTILRLNTTIELFASQHGTFAEIHAWDRNNIGATNVFIYNSISIFVSDASKLQELRMEK
jgi:hypothetical protein